LATDPELDFKRATSAVGQRSEEVLSRAFWN